MPLPSFRRLVRRLPRGRRLLAVTACAVACVAAAGPALGIGFEGSFSGTARARVAPGGGEGLPGSPAAEVDGQAIQGTFRVDIPSPELLDDGGPVRGYGFGDTGEMRIRYTVAGRTFDYLGSIAQDLDPWMYLDGGSTPGAQGLSFRTEYLVRFDGASFGFEAPAGRLYDDVDPATFRVPASLDGVTMRTAFVWPDERLAVRVDVDRFSLRALAAPVPEPSALLLGAAGLAMVAVARRRARRTVPPPTGSPGRPVAAPVDPCP